MGTKTVSPDEVSAAPPRLLHSIRETCDAGHISSATVWRLIARGVLRTTKIGRRTFVQDGSLRRLIEQGAP